MGNPLDRSDRNRRLQPGDLAEWRADGGRRLDRSRRVLSGVRTARLDRESLAIARTVMYASLFDYPLTLAQVRESLIESSQSEDDILSRYAVSDALQAIVEHRHGLFFPRGRADLIATRRAREARSRDFLAEHRHVIRAICALPFVRLVALSGSVAHLNMDRGGDLDLFVVTRGRHVWSVTVAILVLAKLMRRRRQICANFVTSDTHLHLEPHDLFTANQVIHLKPIAGPEVMDDLLAANPFVARFYPNFDRRRAAASPIAVGRCWIQTRRAVEALAGPASAIVERFCRWAYGRHLRTRIGSWQSPEQVRMDADCLKLHTQSHRDATLDRFDRAMTEAVHGAVVDVSRAMAL